MKIRRKRSQSWAAEAADLPPPMVRVVALGHVCRAPPHDVDLSARQTGWSRVEKRGPREAIFLSNN